MDPQLQTLRFWHDLITIYALLLGIEGPVLLWVGTYRERPWRERWLVFVPVLAFGWGAWSAKLINDAQVHAASLVSWSLAHYPSFPVPAGDTAAAAESATRTGRTFGVVATLLLFGGWVLVLRWSREMRGTRSPRRSREAREEVTSSDRTPNVPQPARHSDPQAVRPSTLVTGTLDDDADEGIEITVEPLEK